MGEAIRCWLFHRNGWRDAFRKDRAYQTIFHHVLSWRCRRCDRNGVCDD